MPGIVDLQNIGGGQPNGTTVTPQNTGGVSGDAFNRVSAADIGTANGNFHTFDNTIQGLQYRLGQASTSTNHAYWYLPSAVVGYSFSFNFRFETLPSVMLSSFWRMFSDPITATIALNVNFTASGKISVGDSVAGTQSAASTGSHAVNVTYVMTGFYNQTAGTFTVNTYVLGSETLVATATIAVATSVNIHSMRWGIQTSPAGSNSGAVYRMGDIRSGHGDWLSRIDLSLDYVPMASYVTVTGFTMLGSGAATTAALAKAALGDDSNTSGVVTWANPAGQTISAWIEMLEPPVGNFRVPFKAFRSADATSASAVVTLYKQNTQIGTPKTVPIQSTNATSPPQLFAEFPASELTSLTETDWKTANNIKVVVAFSAA